MKYTKIKKSVFRISDHLLHHVKLKTNCKIFAYKHPKLNCPGFLVSLHVNQQIFTTANFELKLSVTERKKGYWNFRKNFFP